MFLANQNATGYISRTSEEALLWHFKTICTTVDQDFTWMGTVVGAGIGSKQISEEWLCVTLDLKG